MSEDLISVIDVARKTGRRKASIFKVLKRLSIEPTKMRSSASRGQMISYITTKEFRQVLSEMESPENGSSWFVVEPVPPQRGDLANLLIGNVPV